MAPITIAELRILLAEVEGPRDPAREQQGIGAIDLVGERILRRGGRRAGPLDPGGAPPPIAAASAGDGKAVYEKSCALCHGSELQGGGEAPALKGAPFLANWKGKSAALYAFIRQSMPPGAGGSLSDSDYRAVTAYILQANGQKEAGV